MSKASFEIAGIRFTDVDLGVCGISSVKYPSQEEVSAYERGRAAGRAEERTDIVAMLKAHEEQAQRHIGEAGDDVDTEGMELERDVTKHLRERVEARAKAHAVRQDARDGQEGTSAGSDTISRAGGAIP